MNALFGMRVCILLLNNGRPTVRYSYRLFEADLQHSGRGNTLLKYESIVREGEGRASGRAVERGDGLEWVGGMLGCMLD